MAAVLSLIAALVLLIAAPADAAPRPVYANHCFVLRSAIHWGRFWFKPTGLGTYMLYDRNGGFLDKSLHRAKAPGREVEWTLPELRRRIRGLRIVASHGCRPYPEAELGARTHAGTGGRRFKGRRRDGTVLGWADPHMHLTADMRGGGLVISGSAFDRFGITEALGHDADVHGSDGSQDFTGNLLRGGTPTGTHDTHGWPSFAGWPVHDTYTHQQLYYRWLERTWLSGNRLIVAQTVEDKPLCDIEPRKSASTCEETPAIEAQIQRLRGMQDYVDAQEGGQGRGWFRIVTTPQEARRVIERGKLAVLIGVESSNLFGCSESEDQPQCTKADIDRGIARYRELGVRTLFVAHWTDNALAGAALEGGDKGTFISAMEVEQTGHGFRTGPCPYPEQGEEPPATDPGSILGPAKVCNSKGLTELGEYAVNRLIDNGMLIEVDHLSEWARQKVLAIAEQRHYPLVSSHTGTGGLWTPAELKRLYAVGGFAAATVDDAAKIPGKVLALRQYRGPNKTFGVGLGTDTGGFNALPAPASDAKDKPLGYPFKLYHCPISFEREQTGTKTFDVNKDGVAHYGLLPDLLADAQRRENGRAAMGVLFHGAEAYLETWERAAG